MRKVPSFSAFNTAALSGSPGPLISLYNQYRLETPHYHKWACFFGYDIVRCHMAFMHVNVLGGPTSVDLNVPEAVKTHADRVQMVEMLISRSTKPAKIVTSNPYVNRLSYI